eukprot:SM000039S14430  [mRNA]  locus=s39:105938:108284:+ [translate_table: standard]
MRALVCRRLGNPAGPLSAEDSVLSLEEDFPRPERLPHESSVRIKVAAASINFADALIIMGKYQERPTLPYVPGSEVSGVVLEVGANVKSVKAGDRVCAVTGGGGYAEEVFADEAAVFPLPEKCDLLPSAGLPVAFGTSHVGLIHRAGLQAGQVLLVLGAAGGVGLAAVQIGKLFGAVVIAAARGQEKVALLESIGADCAIDTGKTNLHESVKEFLRLRKLRGVDVLYDPVGGSQFKEALRLLNWGAQVVIIGFASGDIPSIQANIALVKNLTIHGLFWGSYMKNNPSVLRRSMTQLLQWLADGYLTVNISHCYELSEADKAFQALLHRKAIGKVVFKIGAPAKL